MKIKYYIYILRDPQNGKTFYVGASKQPRTRYSGHLSKARYELNLARRYDCVASIDQTKSYGYIASLMHVGKKPEMKIVDEIEVWKPPTQALPHEVRKLEAFWYRAFVRSGTVMLNDPAQLQNGCFRVEVLVEVNHQSETAA